MAKYYNNIEGKSKISLRSDADIEVPPHFYEMSSMIISKCSLLQNQIQRIVYVTHGAELLAAKKALVSFPNPKARIDFLLSFPYSEADTIIAAVFNYAKHLFEDIYELRNILAHEKWMTSREFEGVVLFSDMSEEARLLMASGKLMHKDETTSREIYDAIIRYIQKIKVASCSDLHEAIKDADLCGWILMTISHVLDEKDAEKKAAFRSSFLLFKGTSHLFNEHDRISGKMTVQSSKGKKNSPIVVARRLAK